MKKNNSRPQRQRSEFEEQVIQVDRVTRVVAGGRRMRFRATVIVGNRKGKVGMGMGKGDEVVVAVRKAVNEAKKNLVSVNMVNETIPHQVKSKFKSSLVLLLPAPAGTGVIAGGAVRTVVELAGINNILSKAHRSGNKINTSRATLLALGSLQLIEKKEPQKVSA